MVPITPAGIFGSDTAVPSMVRMTCSALTPFSLVA